MDTRILAEAKKDIPLYQGDFANFWSETLSNLSNKQLTDLYAVTLIFKNWLICLNHLNIRNLDDLLKEINEDMNQAFYCGLQGQYRTAHMHLRSVIELSLQLLYFHQHEIEYTQWRDGVFRIKHEDLTNYLKKHPNLKNALTAMLISEVTKNWIHFSKHIHAETPKFFQTQRQSSQTKKISKSDLGVWQSNLLKTGYLINKLFLVFFKRDINRFPTISRELLLRNLNTKDLKHIGLA